MNNAIPSLVKADGATVIDSHGVQLLLLEKDGEFGHHADDSWDGRVMKLSMYALFSFPLSSCELKSLVIPASARRPLRVT